MHLSLPGPRGLAMVASRAIVVLALVGVTGAFTVLHKTVVLDVDGKVSTVTTYGRTVSDVLTVADVSVGADDLVEPQPTDAAHNGGTVVVRTSHHVSVEIDGKQREVITTARTVGELLADLGPGGEGATVNISRSMPLGRGDVRVSTLKTLHVVADGAVIPVTSSEPTVALFLSTIGIVLGDGDTTSVPLDAAAADGMLVVVSRAATSATTVTEVLPFETKEVEDPSLPAGQRVVATAGKVGEATSTYAVDTVGGVEVSRRVQTQVVSREPRTEVIKVGTMTTPTVKVDPGSAQAVAKDLAAQRGWGEDQFACLDKLWQKESGWNLSAENKSSGAYGIPQALPGSKMASAGSDWRTNPATQITWGLGYIEGRYGTPCGAWSHSVSSGWY